MNFRQISEFGLVMGDPPPNIFLKVGTDFVKGELVLQLGYNVLFDAKVVSTGTCYGALPCLNISCSELRELSST